ncbi:hypothetical protein HXY33_08455 [Candidatus Bathyarchaeota archaeon]|nr:hypothetical protein [Candidatus Bathyarchaeota archaeon]
MTEKESETKAHSKLALTSKFRKTILIVLAALFTFSGPYVVLMLSRALNLDYAISMVSGVAIFIVGLVLIWYLIRKRVIY